MEGILDAYLRRVDWDEAGFAIRLYTFTRKRELEEPKSIVIDDEYPVRILIATDAAREGVNLQGHCEDLACAFRLLGRGRRDGSWPGVHGVAVPGA